MGARSKAEIAALFERYGPMVYRRARRILGRHEDAEEAAQEVFIRAMGSAESFEARSQVSTWLYAITTNYCLNKLRDRGRRRELWEEHVVPAAEHADSSAETLVTMRRLLAEADPKWAEAALHVYVDGLSHQEAAEIMGVSRRTVGNLLERFNTWARERLEART